MMSRTTVVVLFNPFPEGCGSKVNMIAWLKFELPYYDVAIEHVNHYTTTNPSNCIVKSWLKYSEEYRRSE